MHRLSLRTSRRLLVFAFSLMCLPEGWAAVPVWTRFEQSFTSSKAYANPLYEVEFAVRFTSSSSRQ